MLNYYLTFMDIAPWAIFVWVIVTIVGKWALFKKMGIKPFKSLIPLYSQYSVFKKIWKTTPFTVLTVLAISTGITVGAFYLGTEKLSPLMSTQLLVFAITCMFLVVLLMYKRIAFVFGHEVGYFLGLIFLNPLFLLILGFGKAKFDPDRATLTGKELRTFQKVHRTKGQRAFNVIMTIFVILAMLGDGVYMFFTELPRFAILEMHNEFHEKHYGNVLGSENVIYPAKEVPAVDDSEIRPLYFPDKSEVEDVVVYMYCVGSDLENAAGFASMNLHQVLEATKEADNLKFVIEAGGSFRWFTEGMKNGEHARYVIEHGKCTKVMSLDRVSMSEPSVLTDFLVWANDNYPAGRKMLFFWNHGGGVLGFGVDDMFTREDMGTVLSLPDITGALEVSGEKYDVIDFDACLMQTVEIGIAMEPYCDYLLASEETEPGSGQYYLEAFKALSADPTMDTVDFAAMMCSNYDDYRTGENDGEIEPANTLSLVDTRMLPGIFDYFTDWFGTYSEFFNEEKYFYLVVAKSIADTYEFAMTDHYDMIDLIETLELEDEYSDEIINLIKAAVPVRNKNSGEHINGLACYVPYKDISRYNHVYSIMGELGLEEQYKAYNNLASVVAVHSGDDYSECDWYVPGFEDVDMVLISHVSLEPEEDVYRVEVKQPDIQSDDGMEIDVVSDVAISLFMKSQNRYASLGTDSMFAYKDDDGYFIDYDGTWVTLNGIPVAVTEVNTQFTNTSVSTLMTVPAKLNLFTPITIYVQRTVYDSGEIEFKVLGYVNNDTEENEEGEEQEYTATLEHTERECKPFKIGSYVSFMYEWYNEDYGHTGSSTGHIPIRVGTGGLTAAQSDISGESYEYYAVVTDVLNDSYNTQYVIHGVG